MKPTSASTPTDDSRKPAKSGGELFIVDNSDADWKVLQYLREWADISHRFDIATGFFEIGSLLGLDGQWQKLDKIRILMGDEVSRRTKDALSAGVKAAQAVLNASIEKEKETNDFLQGVSTIVEALRRRQIECRVYNKEKFHAKAYITHAKQAVVGASALVGSSNFTMPGLTRNVELNIQIRREVALLQEWYERHWNDAEDITEEVFKVIERQVKQYAPFDVYAKAMQQFYRGHEMTDDEWERAGAQNNGSRMYPILDKYQQDGYKSLMKISCQHRGAFLCDGVGLGKTFIGLMLIERLIIRERKRVVLFVPKAGRIPVWERTLRKYLPNIGRVFSNLEIFNHTDLLRSADFPQKLADIASLADVVIMDEAHHFRNPGAYGRSRYWRMFDLCKGKTVFLLTATPINNSLLDLQHMIELFTQRQADYFKGAPLGIHSLPGHFRKMEKELERLVSGEPAVQPDLIPEVTEVEAGQVLANDAMFHQLVVQRSRAYVKASQEQQGGKNKTIFPVRDDPQVAEYSIKKTYGRLLDMVEQAFFKIKPLFSLAVYYPLAYYKGPKADIDPISENRQKQVVGLIRTQFLKRFESSARAFEMSCATLLVKLLAWATKHSVTDSEKSRLERWQQQHAELIGYVNEHQLEFFGEQPPGEADEDIVTDEMLDVKPDDPFVLILDIATGTATFLNECIEIIERTMKTKWARALGKRDPESPRAWRDPEILARWRDYVPKHLLPRLYGFEIMMAPYAIAHLKLALKLGETGYQFRDGDRLHIYLTNTLEPPSEIADAKLADLFGPLAREAQELNHIKRSKRFTVVIGNPPYSNFGQLNKIPFILNLLEDYKRGLDEKKINLDDDFIKFICFSQTLLKHTDVGVLGFITNNVYLDGLTHRRMRQSMIETFPRTWLLNLHGSAKKLETSRDEGREENVFDIQQGVAIALCLRGKNGNESITAHEDLWGTRESKYRALASSSVTKTNWRKLSPAPPHFFLAPKNLSGGEEYQSAPGLADAFAVFQNGLKTDRDELFFDFSRDELEGRMRQFYSKKYSAEFVEQFGIHPSSSYDIEARRDQTRFATTSVHHCLYRPFDIRWLYYDPDLTSRPATKVMRHQLAGRNLALICLRQTRRNEEGTFLVSRHLINKDAVSLFDIGTVFPLFIYDETLSFDLGSRDVGVAHSKNSRPNFTPSFLKALAAALKLPKKGAHGLPEGVTPEDIFHYAYGVFHSPGYRSRYVQFLKTDFPRLPLTGNLELFRALARLGGELVALHLLESPKLDDASTEYLGGRAPEVEKVSWSKNTVWLDKAQTAGFKGVREDVWNFHIGGYQVCEKWLKDRKGRTLSAEDRVHYQKIVVALSETIRLMKEIDAVIEEHGGWPLK